MTGSAVLTPTIGAAGVIVHTWVGTQTTPTQGVSPERTPDGSRPRAGTRRSPAPARAACRSLTAGAPASSAGASPGPSLHFCSARP